MIKFLTEKHLKQIKVNKKKIVLCHGVFDLFHVGHLNHLKEARKLGDILIISVTVDKYVNKGVGRPFFNLNQRLSVLSSVEFVDFVVASEEPDSVSIIKKIKPDIYFKGPDYLNHEDDFTGFIKKEINAVKKINGKIVYGSGEAFSSSKVLNEITDLTDKQRKFISKIKKENTFKSIYTNILKLKKIKILVIGEMIIDKFVFCRALGKSGKEAILSLEKISEKEYVGGVGSIGNHLSDFVKDINIITYLGSYDNRKKFIDKNTNKNVHIDYIVKNSSPTIVKSKIIDLSNNSKLLGLYSFNDKKLLPSEEKKLSGKIKKKIKKHDVVIVSDYGHSFLDKKTANYLSNKKSLIVNTQLNSANIGYHTIGKYKNSNWVVINEVELRHELRNRYDNIKNLMFKLSKKLNIKNLIVTCGKNGSYYYNKKKHEYIYCPSFAKNVVDKIGAGDTFMAIFSILNKCFPKKIDLSLFLSSLAVTEVLGGFGSEKVVRLNNLLKATKYILK